MTTFKYKTRGMSDPQGKQNVYFCCHPDDFDRYFEPIAEEILAKQNCAVWYADPDAERDEDFFDDLTQIQLFVMPVTSRLLCTKNHARDREFPFATQQGIPVLPLMQERELAELFNTKCGNLQFLDKYNTDPTAISYDAQLEKFLAAALIGDELAEKIRSAFDAYIFLSYRKKDRRYAQELMRLIHKNDFCRDIAIWYDEYLVPGEDFNEAIQKMLLSSELFAMAVTPNLVNESNYVKTDEFPAAIRKDMPILAAEFVPTDKELLSKQYQGIPACTDARDEAALSAALQAAIRKITLREHDATPEHTFFIGLAYLSGVDVEIDHDRAYTLITSAADSGVLEAFDKLAEMYRKGIGVARSYPTAAEWMEKKIPWLEAAWKEASDEETLRALIWGILGCGEACWDLGWTKKALEKYTAAHDYAASSPYLDTNLDIQRDWSICCYHLGKVRLAAGDRAGAMTYFQQTRAAQEVLAKTCGTVDAMQDFAVICEKIGDYFRDDGDIDAAMPYYKNSLEIQEVIAKGADTLDARRDLAVCYNKLGDIYLAGDQRFDAKYYYEKALSITVAIEAEIGTTDARRDLAISHEKIGDVCEADKDLAGAMEAQQKAFEIRSALADEIDTAEARRDLMISYERLARLHKIAGSLSSARLFCEMALTLSRALAEETYSVEARRDLAVCRGTLGDIYHAEGDLTGARRCHQENLHTLSVLARDTDTGRNWDDLAVTYYKLAMLSEKKRNEYLEEAAEIYEKLCRTRPHIARYRKNLEAIRSLLH